jgi:hypothetical protein
VSLSAHEQEAWLNRAEAQKWSRNQLRHHLKVARGKARDRRAEDVGDSAVQRISFDAALVHRWRAAAEQTGSDFQAWVVSTLDAAASGVLSDRYKSAS